MDEQIHDIGGVRVRVIKGDITEIECCAVVNAANNHLWMGSGVAGALKKVGGVDIEREALEKGPIEIGNVVETKAGHLSAKWVIHAAVMGQTLETSAEIVTRATSNALRLAERLGVKSIALPALGTGVGALPMEDCARAMRSGMETVLPLKSIEEIVFVLFGPRAFNAFKSAF